MFVDPLATTVDHMTVHSYISKAQSMYLMIQKESLDSDTYIVMLDFAEDYQYNCMFLSCHVHISE